MSQQPSQFQITKASFTADRIGGFETTFFDIKNQIVEINIYESIYNLALTGNITVVDDKALYDEVNFQGNERLRLELSGATVNAEPLMDKTFIMTGIETEDRAGDKQSVYTFSLLEEHAFISSAEKLRNSYRGTISQMVSNIALSQLKKSVDASYTGGIDSIQTAMRVIIPNLNPIKAIKWLMSRATTNTGSPFFLWASLHDDNLRFGNLDTMYTQEPWNQSLPYTYNPANTNVAEGLSELEQGFTISTIFPGESGNLLRLLRNGNIGANQETTNLNTGQIERRHFDVLETLTNLSNAEVIDMTKQNVYDDEFLLKNKPLALFDAMNIHSVVSTGTYGDYKSYHDEFDKSLLTKKLESSVIKNLLLKNTMSVAVPGTAFFLGKATVGDTVNLKVVNSNIEVGNQSSEDDLLDKKKSGKHLILELRHTFVGEKHKVLMQVAKLEAER
tara:strand:+ start:6227 stop:7564 length:1338 start_codon:yes stop_codon:yes gene_type:complete